ncbi:MAG: associated golgi family protein [Cyanobacteria bacterium RYN_339]|nr:associated golgi family protein [Cyanobacteria bacterium RYN_339]
MLEFPAMDLLHQFVDLFLHLDKHLDVVIQQYGTLTYLLLFMIIFCETGLVITPFLPGDSLLFAAGAFAAKGSLDAWVVFGLLWFAAVLGDNLNYWIGVVVGPRVFSSESSKLFNREHLDRTQAYYDKYGAKTLVIARFVPIVRTFAPFVAGIGKMRYFKFLAISVAGGGLWMSLFVWAGYFFGNIPAVKHNFTLVIFAVIGVSLLPGLIEYLRHRRQASVLE